jgi:hypothetical protein
VEVACCFVEAGFFGKSSCVYDKYDAANVLGVGKLRGRIVAELAMAGRVEEKEAAWALKGWVAGGAVMRGCGDMWAGKQSFDGERLGGGVGLSDRVTFGLSGGAGG